MNDHRISDDVDKLSIAAKVHYISAERGAATTEQIRRRALELGWNIDDADIAAVEGYLEHLRLVPVA
ncbi:MAG: hypothetical protein IT307_18040 [Chloroflexi bacterium]|nr:hypothetical protein [Chloroflexota bacterium]